MPKNSSASEPQWLHINKSEEAVTLDLSSLCEAARRPSKSPIDDYYGSSKTLLIRSASPEFADDPGLLRLLILGQMSLTEGYFRRLLANLLNICPLTRDSAASEAVALNAVWYYEPSELGYGLLENHSMSGGREIRSRTEKVTGIKINDNSSVSAALDAFDAVCHIRHAAIHSDGELSARNAQQLKAGTGRFVLRVTPIGFQSVVAVCHNAVRSYNRFLFGKVLDRWIGAGLLSGTWSEDRSRFRPLYVLFYSTDDREGYQSAYQAYRQLAKHVLS